MRHRHRHLPRSRGRRCAARPDQASGIGSRPSRPFPRRVREGADQPFGLEMVANHASRGRAGRGAVMSGAGYTVGRPSRRRRRALADVVQNRRAWLVRRPRSEVVIAVGLVAFIAVAFIKPWGSPARPADVRPTASAAVLAPTATPTAGPTPSPIGAEQIGATITWVPVGAAPVGLVDVDGDLWFAADGGHLVRIGIDDIDRDRGRPRPEAVLREGRACRRRREPVGHRCRRPLHRAARHRESRGQSYPGDRDGADGHRQDRRSRHRWRPALVLRRRACLSGDPSERHAATASRPRCCTARTSSPRR